LARSLVAKGAASQALPILRGFPVSKEFGKAEELIALAQALSMANHGEHHEIEDSLAIQFHAALGMASNGQLYAAMDGLLDILRQNKSYRREEIRRLILGFLVVLGEDNPQTRNYRSELTSLLF
jgi:putative thioredoxin